MKGVNMKKIMNYNTKLIDRYLEENHLTKKEFCKKCGISLYTLDSFYKSRDIDIIQFFRVFKVLGKPKDFID